MNTSFLKKSALLLIALSLTQAMVSCNDIEHEAVNNSVSSSQESSTIQSQTASQTSQASNDVAENLLNNSKTALDCIAITANDTSLKAPLDNGFFEWCGLQYKDYTWELEYSENPYCFYDAFCALCENGFTSNTALYFLTQRSALVLYDEYTNAFEGQKYYNLGNSKSGEIELIFGGDICLADNYKPMEYLAQTNMGITDAIDQSLITDLQNADIAMLNNEFAISDRGQAMPGKLYTFISKTSNTSLYNLLGIDIVLLANNHCYDYGKDAFFDTLATLKEYNIEYVGAGENIEEASSAVYYVVDGIKIAYVAATRAEKYILTPEATETEGGVLRTYDSAKYCEVIKNAAANSDYVIASVHWGTEDTHVLEDVQIEMGYEYIDSGADIIIGTHAHCLQGVEFYNSKPIIYNLGNFWFNAYDIDTGLLKVKIDDLESGLSLEFIPCIQRDCQTRDKTNTEDGTRILEYMESISINADFDENGNITEIVE